MTLVLAETRGPVGVARLNRPEARNALSPALMEELAEIAERWDADPEVRSIVIAGGVAPAGEWLEAALELAEVVARRPPLAVRLCKQAVLAADETPLTAGLDQERRLYELAMATEDLVEGMNASIEKRRPELRGR
jgi:enoyl-CoA hydratase/carnithine racemase